MSTKKDKRVENRGEGYISINGFGDKEFKINNKTIKNILLFVEREPDNLMAAAIICSNCKGNFTVKFTDRHSINYDITKYSREMDCDGICILCPSINEYSILFLERINKPYYYIGSTTKLDNKFRNENTYVTITPITKIISGYFNVKGEMIEEVIAYTNKYIAEKFNLFNVIRYQYLTFKLSAKDMFKLLLESYKDNNATLKMPFSIEDAIKATYDNQVSKCEDIMDKAIIKENKGKKYAFVQGGCPCTLILNYCLRHKDIDVCINVCTHRQHFTAISKQNIYHLYEENIESFIYSGCGENSAGGCFEKDCTIDKFINAFFEKIKIHGFYDDRRHDYTIFDPDEYEWIQGNIYKNFNFTIFLDSYCNADCRFCVEQIKTRNTGKIEKTRIEDKDTYVKRLDKVLKNIRPYNPSISVTGGEPLMSPWFKDVMKLLKKYKFRKTVITTNGTNIKEHMDEIIDARISHVNFSRPHYDESIVQDIMRFREKDNITKYSEFKEIIKYLEEHNVRTRFNCIMSKNGISSLEEMKKYMDFIGSLGCHHVVFRELMSFNEDTAMNEEKIIYSRNNRVFMNDIWKNIDSDKDFKPLMNMQGHYYYIEIYEYKDMTMVSERANLKMLENSQKVNKDYLYEMVFHPNGNLCAGWTEDKDILDDMNEEEFLSGYDSSKYDKPSVAVDLLLFTIKDNKLQVLLINRDKMPQLAKLALPGVIVGINESLDDAVKRCLLDKAGLKNIFFEQLYTFGAVDRDPRMRMISVAYYALVPLEKLTELRDVSILDNLYDINDLNNIAFDHKEIIDYAVERIRNKVEYSNIAFSLLPEQFTLSVLQNVYEILLQKNLYKANFRKKIMPLVVETGNTTCGESHRPSMLYKFKFYININ